MFPLGFFILIKKHFCSEAWRLEYVILFILLRCLCSCCVRLKVQRTDKQKLPVVNVAIPQQRIHIQETEAFVPESATRSYSAKAIAVIYQTPVEQVEHKLPEKPLLLFAQV